MQFDFPDGQTVRVNIANAKALLESAEQHLTAGQGFALATINVDHLERLSHDTDFRRAYAAHDLVVADGNPIVWLSRLARQPVELVPGSDMVSPLCALAARNDLPVALIGGSETSLRIAGEKLRTDHPGLRIAMRAVPGFPFDPDSPEADQLITKIGASGARLCLLALGAPRQERFAIRARNALPGVGFASIGAGLDFISGSQRRAPVWLRKIRMEWCWRMFSNPRRLARRYAKGFIILPGHALRAFAKRNRNN